ncbi:MAG: hypothetical protein CEE40_10425 [Chloroflexi bacterium B3_Chlor]|nr:MAG: hypothetical protein CEE40_10425 [Chloroflexi bacterium B3_Chlor]
MATRRLPSSHACWRLDLVARTEERRRRIDVQSDTITLALKEYMPPDCTCCFRGPGCKVAVEKDPEAYIAKEASEN